MFDGLLQSHYFVMVLQITVTLVIVPLYSYKILSKTANEYGVRTYPKAVTEVQRLLYRSSKIYWGTVAFLLIFNGILVASAINKQGELLAWDDQSGIMIMYLLAMIPVVLMIFIHKRLFKILKTHAGGKRSASLQPKRLMNFISKPLLILIGLANLVFLGSVFYFVQHPFDGFAGYGNLIGLLALNLLFGGIIGFVFRDNKSGNFSHPDHRDAFKRKVIHINMLILALAVLHIALSLWVAGSELREYKILVQSIYLQMVLVITANMLTLPRAMFGKQTESAT